MTRIFCFIAIVCVGVSAQTKTTPLPAPAPLAKTDTAAKPVKSDTIATAPGAVSIADTVQKKTDSTQVKTGDTLAADSVKNDSAETGKLVIEEQEIRIRGGDIPDYRSPRRALFYSLLVPGAGQYYARSKVKAAGFLAVEASLFAVRYYFNKQGDDKDRVFRDFSDAHYKDSTYAAWYRWTGIDTATNQIGLDTNYKAHDAFYQDEKSRKSQQYYEMINKYNQFVYGWDDVEPSLDSMQSGEIPDTIAGHAVLAYDQYRLVVEQLDTILGYSQNQIHAAQLSAESNSEYRKADNVWFAILLNHVCSAVDAALTAKRHNQLMLKQKLSLLHRMHIESRMFAGAVGPIPGVLVRVDF